MKAATVVPDPGPHKGGDLHGVNTFVVRALQKLLQQAQKKQTALREACEAALTVLDPKPGIQSAGDSDHEQLTPDKFFLPFKMACESKVTKLMETSLDCLQKMIAYGYIVPASNMDSKFIDNVIETICSCFDHPEDSVQLQILKALLTAVTSNTFELHEGSLLLSVRTCYNIYLVSKNPTNQTTAKATLTQMLNVIFSRMEKDPSTIPSSRPAIEFSVRGPQAMVTPEIIAKGVISNIIEQVVTDDSNNQNARGTPTLENFGSCIVCAKAATFRCEQTQQPVCSMQCKAKNLENPAPSTPASSHRSGLSFHSKQSKPQDTVADDFGTADQPGSGFANIYQKDAFLLFQAFCKLSIKPLPEGNTPDSVPLRSKLLTLELLQNVLENSGATFRTGDKFIQGVKQSLFLSLLRNCAYAIPSVFQLCLTIFQALMHHFKDHLKTEIGVFFTNIFLKILESANMGPQQKIMVLNVLYKICQDPQTIVDLFLNYDCDLEALDIFDRMVKDLARIAQHPMVVEKSEWAAQEADVKLLGLKAVVAILKSMVEWSQRPSNDPDPTDDPGERGDGGSEDGRMIGPGSRSSSSNSLRKFIPDEDLFLRQKAQKLELEQAVIKFNLNGPKKGIRFLIESGKIDGSAASIARFLRTSDGLDKNHIGEYLGEGEQFNIQVLYAYVDSIDFTGLGFDDGLRAFLSGFRLPGEAQKIDRMMEKFAEKYCRDNPGVFATADTAYILAYAVIMLNTDANNPAVTKKMSKDAFVTNLRGINDNADLPRDFLEELYDRIKKSPFKVKDDDPLPETNVGNATRKKGGLFHPEVESMVVRTQMAIKKKPKSKTVYFQATNSQHVRPMFDAAWAPVLAALSVILEQSDDAQVVALCLEGFRHAIRISGSFYMDTERNAFVSSIAKFTYLQSRIVMKPKNIEAIKTLIQIAHTDGNYLMSSWAQVLQSISQLERLQLIAMGANSAILAPDEPRPASTASGRGSLELSSRPASHKASNKVTNVDHLNAGNILDEIDVQSIDRIFTNSPNLNSDAIVEFIEHLCRVSLEEISSANSPRVFSLQKIVEIAYFNMGRIRYVWSRIWRHLGDFFTTVGCNQNLSIAMYAIDSLRQLAMKFLEKDELSNFQFQKEFLKPFEYIMANTPCLEIRELVLRCLSQMMLARASNIKSGWKSMFAVFALAAGDSQEFMVQLAFETVEKIVREHFALVTDTFVDCVNCLICFAGNKLSTSICLRALDHIKFCGGKLAEGAVCKMTMSNSEPPRPQFSSDDPLHAKLWFPILTGLSKLIDDPRAAIRARALEVLFGVLQRHGSMLEPALWALIFRGVLIPIFDDVRHPKAPSHLKDDNDWLKTTCFAALQSLTELFSHFFDILEFLLTEILDLLTSCITQEREGVARIGVTCVSQLITQTGDRFNANTWTTVCTCLQQLFDTTTPRQLFTIASPSTSSPRSALPSSLQNGSLPVPPSTALQEPGTPTPSADIDSSRRLDGDDEVTSENSPLTPATSRLTDDGSFGAKRGTSTNIDFKDIRCKCIVQLLLIQAVNDLVAKHYSVLSIANLTIVLDALHASFTFARSFNQNMDLRISLWRAGFMNQVPNLLKQENNGTSCCLRILFRMYAEKDTALAQRRQVAQPRLISLCHDVVTAYLSKSSDRSLVAEQQRELLTLTPILALVLKGFYQFDDDQFRRHLSLFYPLFTELILSDSLDIRTILRDIFSNRIRPLLNLPL